MAFTLPRGLRPRLSALSLVIGVVGPGKTTREGASVGPIGAPGGARATVGLLLSTDCCREAWRLAQQNSSTGVLPPERGFFLLPLQGAGPLTTEELGLQVGG